MPDASRLFAAAATLAVLMFLLAQLGGRWRTTLQRAAIMVYVLLVAAVLGYIALWWLGR